MPHTETVDLLPKALDLKKITPTLIFIEYSHLSDKDNCALCRLLRRNGYSVHDTGRDYLAIHKRTARKQTLYA